MKIPDEYLKLHRRCYGTFDKASVAECSCFNCKRVFSGAEIKEVKYEKYGDKSAICPYCKEDTVIPEKLDTETIESLNKYFLSPLN